MVARLNYFKANSKIAVRVAIAPLLLFFFMLYALRGPWAGDDGPFLAAVFVMGLCVISPFVALLAFSTAAYFLTDRASLSALSVCVLAVPIVFAISFILAAFVVFYGWDYSISSSLAWVFMGRFITLAGILLSAFILPFAWAWLRIAAEPVHVAGRADA